MKKSEWEKCEEKLEYDAGILKIMGTLSKALWREMDLTLLRMKTCLTEMEGKEYDDHEKQFKKYSRLVYSIGKSVEALNESVTRLEEEAKK